MSNTKTRPSTANRYEDRVVALVDILGWRGLLCQDHERPPEVACRAIDRLQLEISSQAAAEQSGHRPPGADFTVFQLNLKDQYTDYGISSDSPNEGNFQLNQFSDHLLLSCRTEGITPRIMIERMSNLLWTMLASGLFLRGAVVVGKLVHSSTTALGPALIRAHFLESRVAIYPRVIVDDALEDVINHSAPTGVRLDRLMGQPLCRDPDGLLFIDFIRSRFLRARVVDGMETWRSIHDSLLERRRQHAEKPDVLAKDNWMIAYFNDVVRQAPELASLEIK
jgi:hypothetical protein